MLQQAQGWTGDPRAHGAPPGYGAPPPGGYGGPEPGHGGPQPYPVQGFGSAQPFGTYGPGYVERGWASGWSELFWVRLCVAAVVVFLSLLGACVSAIAH